MKKFKYILGYFLSGILGLFVVSCSSCVNDQEDTGVVSLAASTPDASPPVSIAYACEQAGFAYCSRFDICGPSTPFGSNPTSATCLHDVIKQCCDDLECISNKVLPYSDVVSCVLAFSSLPCTALPGSFPGACSGVASGGKPFDCSDQ